MTHNSFLHGKLDKLPTIGTTDYIKLRNSYLNGDRSIRKYIKANLHIYRYIKVLEPILNMKDLQVAPCIREVYSIDYFHIYLTPGMLDHIVAMISACIKSTLTQDQTNAVFRRINERSKNVSNFPFRLPVQMANRFKDGYFTIESPWAYHRMRLSEDLPLFIGHV